jgi:ERCC4-type nuclease
MNYIIKIDNREKYLIELFKKKGYDIESENLDLGDFQIIDLETKEIIIIIERKTFSDLSASIKDNRYHEQKNRLKNSLKSSVRKIILLEGKNISDFTLSEDAFHSSILNTMVRDNLHVYISKDLENTVSFIENLILQLSKYYENLQKEIVLGEEFVESSGVHVKKKDNLTKNTCFENMLVQIPGISIKIATVFTTKYKNIFDFMKNMENQFGGEEGFKERVIEFIENEKFGLKNRKVGNILAQKIYFYIFDQENKDFEKMDVPKKKKTVSKTVSKKNNLSYASLFSS